MTVDWPNLWQLVTAEFPLDIYSTHGPSHWRRVERNGLLLATRSGADLTVVRLFALFHDSQRHSENHDPQHGKRGAALAAKFRAEHFPIDDDAFAKLIHACTWHTAEEQHEDPTIATCYDADRLDLGRVGVIPKAKFMNTDFGREIARFGSIQPYLDGDR